jgi:ParB family chromosome partitioning protein
MSGNGPEEVLSRRSRRFPPHRATFDRSKVESATEEKEATPKRKKQVAPEPRGLRATQLAGSPPPSRIDALASDVERDGGSVLAIFRDPLGGNWQLLAGLPIELVEPTPYQRDLSDAHVKRLTQAIGKLDRYLDPVIAVRSEIGKYWTPNGHHRTAALRALGCRSITALLVPEENVAHKILLLNTEKAHNLRERSLEVIRLAHGLAELDPRPERDFELEFEEASLLTLGLCYEARGRFAGGAFHPILARVDKFMTAALPKAVETRRERAGKLLELEDSVNDAVTELKKRGLESPYLKAFVVARINPIRFKRGAQADFDETIAKMLEAASRFDAAKVRSDQLARAAGPPAES